MNKLAVLGAGSWGTALAIALSSRFDVIALWGHTATHIDECCRNRQNQRYLPGFALPDCIRPTNSLSDALRDASTVLVVVPSAHLRSVLCEARMYLAPEAKFVSAIKGIEHGSLLRMSQVIADVLEQCDLSSIAVLSGPTFAKEVAAGEPAAVVVASESRAHAEEVQKSFSTASLRLYVSQDVTGVELGAALKNVIAIGGGICKGLGLGNNTVAALVTRGLAEITRLAVAMGGHPQTLGGLAGLGDLVLTATGDLSRNRMVGIQLGQGLELSQILSAMPMVAEGVRTCEAAHQLGKRLHVELPIIEQMYEVLYRSKHPHQAIRELMERPLRAEHAVEQ